MSREFVHNITLAWRGRLKLFDEEKDENRKKKEGKIKENGREASMSFRHFPRRFVYWKKLNYGFEHIYFIPFYSFKV